MGRWVECGFAAKTHVRTSHTKHVYFLEVTTARVTWASVHEALNSIARENKIQLIINVHQPLTGTCRTRYGGLWAVLVQIGVCGTNKAVSVDRLSATYYIQTYYDLYNTVSIGLLVVSAEEQRMSTAAWTKFGDLARAWPLASRVAYSAFSHTAAILEEKGEQLSPGASLQRGSLQRSFLMLEDLDTVIRNISPERRRKIQAAAERGLCRYMRDVELELQRCVLLNPVSFFRSEPAALTDFTTSTTTCAIYTRSSRFSNVISQSRCFTMSSWGSNRLSMDF